MGSMNFKKNDMYSALLFALSLGAFSGLSLVSMKSAYLESRKEIFNDENMENHPNTYIGRRFVNQECVNEEKLLSGKLNLVLYESQYFVVDENLKMIGTDEYFKVVDSKEERGVKRQILYTDIIPFTTVLKNGKAQITLEEAYEMVESWDNHMPLFPVYHEEGCSLNENPCQVGKDLVSELSFRDEDYYYFPHNLYVVNQNGNLYLCKEDQKGNFFVLHNGENEAKTFRFSIGEGQNGISKYQVKSFSMMLEMAGYSADNPQRYTIEQCYQLLETALQILGNVSFSPSYSTYYGYSKAQVQYANRYYFAQVDSYLDDYHVDSKDQRKTYPIDSVSIVKCGLHDYVLASSVIYDSEKKCYIIEPLQSSGKNLECMREYGEIIVVPFSSVFNMPDVDFMCAESYYTIFRDYLIHNGTDFILPYEVSSQLDSCLFPTLEDLGKKLELKLEYSD